MNIKVGFVVLSIVIQAGFALGQRAVPEDNLGYPVFIQLSTGNNKTEFGTGFYLNHNSHMYLVTARHVLLQPPNHTLKSETATFISYGRNASDDSRNALIVNLKELLQTGLMRYHKVYDVAVIQLADTALSNTGLRVWDFNSSVTIKSKARTGLVSVATASTKKFDEVLIANEVYIFGYPVGLGFKKSPQFNYSKPLLRRGIVAGKYLKAKTLVLDCPAYGENSGGPILELSRVQGFRTKLRIIGHISQFIPVVELTINKSQRDTTATVSNSGYSIGIPMDFVFDLLATQ